MTNPFSKASRRGALVALGVAASLLLSVFAPAVSAVSGCSGDEPDGAGTSLCRFKSVGSLRVSKAAGLGRIELHGKIGAVLQRDEGTVSLLDLSDPARPKKVGEYADDIDDSFDGDLAFSDDGKWLFYARQTHQFSKDGIHVLNVSDPSAPSLMHYQPAGGAYRIAYHKDAAGEWVMLLDATHGLVVYRFEPTTGQLVPAFIDPLPALKVGGPASAGFYIDPEDPRLKVPLMYVTTGMTGLQVYDISDPSAPDLLGEWSTVGLAEVEVSATAKSRTVYAATEYWFDASIESEVVVLDASKLDAIKERRRLSAGAGTEETLRVQGMSLSGSRLLIAHSGMGMISATPRGGFTGWAKIAGVLNEGAGVLGAPFAMDVEQARGHIYLTDAATGMLSVLRPTQ
jgi:hypothetical protein